jgi:outer membrane protein OmpA-like peptidoglycan-associated protein
MKNNLVKIKLASAFILILSLFTSCKSGDHLRGYEMQKEVSDYSDSTLKQVYITSTKPIDSADVKKLIFDIFRVDIAGYPDSLKVFARVYDSTGHFITNMADPYKKNAAAKYFSAITEYLGKTYNIRNVPVDKFKVREYGALDSIPYSIVLSVDYSGSMDPVKEAIFNGTEIFVSLKSSYDNIALTSFNKDFTVKVPFEKDKKQILNLYKTKRGEGFGLFSAVNDAVWNSEKMLEEMPADVPRILVIFSDGDDNYSKKNLGELIERAKAQQVHIFSVAFGYSIDENLKALAQYTGGKFYKAYSNEELVNIFRDIYNSLKYYYLITYKPPKYWGVHKLVASLNIPGRSDTLQAEGIYDTSNLFELDTNGKFTRPIFFDFDSSVIKTESYPILDELADAMLSMPRLKIEVRGHTDNKGTIEYNQKLSEERARAVVEALIQRGVDERRLRYRGFGMSQPLMSNQSDEGRAKNRRTEFVILAK